jgi:hypothetical protein
LFSDEEAQGAGDEHAPADAGANAAPTYTISVDKVHTVSVKDKAQTFDPYFLDSVDTVTPQGREAFPENSVGC